MKTLAIRAFLLLAVVALISFTGCEDKIDPLVNELDKDRELSPIGLQANIRNETTIELNWTTDDSIEEYIVEFSEDSLEFSSIIRTITVTGDQLPVQEVFFGDTRYSARVKAVGTDGINDSKWSVVTIRTNPENILLPMENDGLGITGLVIRWPEGQEATHFVINPGNVERTITASEVENGEAAITGLNYYTDYEVTMFAGNSQRGNLTAKTLMDPDCPACVKLSPGNDISDAVDAAAAGSIIVLMPGTYSEQGAIAITKAVTVRGAVYYDKPVVYGQFTCATAVTSLNVEDAVFRGDTGTPLAQFFNTLAGSNLTTLSIDNCEIRNYSNGVIYNNASGVFGAITISNTYAHTMAGSGGDGFDFRNGTIGSLTVENSTFANGYRNFLRMQVACAVSFDHCTFYKISVLDNSNNNGLFRMNKTAGGSFQVRNSLFSETGVLNPATVQAGNFCRQDSYMVENPTYANNNIHSCYNLLVGLYTSASQVNASELNPGFVNAAGGDLTITNQTLIDNEVGDPRWRP